MLDAHPIADPSEALWLDTLKRLTRELIQDRAKLIRQIEEHGETPRGFPHLSGQPLLRRRDSFLGSSSWLMLDREHLWSIAAGTTPANVETDRGPARAYRGQRTYQLETALEILLGRLYRLQAEATAAGLPWADLVSAAVGAST